MHLSAFTFAFNRPDLAKIRMVWSFWDKAQLSRMSGQGWIVPSPHGIVPGKRKDPRQSPGSSCRAVSTKPSPELAIARAAATLWHQMGKKGSPSIPRRTTPVVMAFSMSGRLLL